MRRNMGQRPVLATDWMRRCIHQRTAPESTCIYKFRVARMAGVAIFRLADAVANSGENFMKLFSINALLILLWCCFSVGQQNAAERPTMTEGPTSLCAPASLPKNIRDTLTTKFADMKIQASTSLGPGALKRWQSEKPLRCPGIARGEFVGTKEPSYAVLLVPRTLKGNGYKLLSFSRMPGKTLYSSAALEESDKDVSSNFFIRAAALNRFFDEQSRRKFHSRTKDGILLVDSGNDEYEANIFFWTIKEFKHEPVDY